MKKINLLELLVCLVVFFLPFYLLRTKIWFVPTNFLEIFIILVFLVVFYLKRKELKIEAFFLKYKMYIAIGGLMFLGLTLSAILNGNNYGSWGIIKSWFLLPIIFILTCGVAMKKENVSKLFEAYFYSTVVVAIASLVYFFLNKITYDGRLAGIFPSPNYLAMYLSPAIIIFLFQEEKNRTKKIIPLGLILIALYLTYSYAAWLSVVFSLGMVLFWKNNKKLTNNFYSKVFILIVVIFLLFLSQAQKDKFNSLITLDERSSLASRVMIWKASFKMIENNFLFGVGAGNFQDIYLEYQKFYPPYLNWAVSHPNNLYLNWWLYGGLLGVSGFLLLTILFFKDILRKKQPSEVAWIAFGVMLLILFHGIFDTTYFKNDLAVIFWLNFLALKN